MFNLDLIYQTFDRTILGVGFCSVIHACETTTSSTCLFHLTNFFFLVINLIWSSEKWKNECRAGPLLSVLFCSFAKISLESIEISDVCSRKREMYCWFSAAYIFHVSWGEVIESRWSQGLLVLLRSLLFSLFWKEKYAIIRENLF